jgi:UDP-glucose 4-epimerase
LGHEQGSEALLKILVTGGAGFIGANFVRLALSAGNDVCVLDDLTVGKVQYIEGLPLRFIRGTILDEELLRHEVAQHDAVVHLAAQSGVPTSLKDPRKDCQLNVLGTLNMLEACRVAGDEKRRRFVYASSNAPLGRQVPPATEDKACLPVSPYGASKLAGEAYCLAYQGSWGIPTVALRFGNVYGPYSAHKKSAVAKFLDDIEATGAITIEGDGLQTRDFVYVEDLARALMAALESSAEGEVFQISTGTETSIQTLSELIEAVVGQKIKTNRASARAGDVRRNYSVITKAEQMLGWKPHVSLEDGLRRTYEWRAGWKG